MLCWFVGASLAAVWLVFRDPRFDVRLLTVGAVLPELDAVAGAPVLHTLVASLVLLAVVMVATLGRRPARRLWLGLPIGTLLHLVVDGAWVEGRTFWWPALGWDLAGARLPIVERGWWNVPLELAGFAILAWFWRAAGLGDPARRAAVARTGRLFETLPEAPGQ